MGSAPLVYALEIATYICQLLGRTQYSEQFADDVVALTAARLVLALNCLVPLQLVAHGAH